MAFCSLLHTLKQLYCRLTLNIPAPLSQIHDEVILEGPKESAQLVKELVVQHMANPWACKDFGMSESIKQPLRVELLTDCKIANTWIEAK